MHNLESGEEIATHELHLGKGRTRCNENHYRYHRQREADLEQAFARRLGEPLGRQLCTYLRTTMPRHYKNQLAGTKRVLEAEPELDRALITGWVMRERLTAGMLKERLEATRQARARGRDPADAAPAAGSMPSDLTPSARLGRSSG
ncbi:hypothetical protein FEI13_08240 [Halomonas urmiana]|uniref:Uncharacterized protein n=1 Tax=Halomonas urmiana TaxID=490901 RepID=A0A5R8MI58_9GAMM|nr:hypothetical protein [Halomonas urmiana]TLF51647.1 hypothetical protein FEI13_08240 [Halomonas urmiana]